MSSSINKVTLIGNLGANPDIRTLSSGDRVANMSLATSEQWVDKNTGENREKTEWHRVVVYGNGLVSVIEKYLKKGSKIYVEGKLETRNYTDKNGVDRYTSEVVIKPYAGELSMLSGIKAAA